MKKLRNPIHVLCSATAIMMAASYSVSATQIITHRFNTASTVNNWTRWWGSAPATNAFDASMDMAGNLASGALKVSVGFNYASYGGDNQFAIRGALSGDGNLNGLVVDANAYDRLEFDLYWDPNSPTRVGTGDYGGLDVGLVPTDYSQVWFPNFAVTNAGSWTHVVLSITNMTGSLTNIGGVVLKMWSGNASSAQTGTAIFWVDNLKLIPKTFITDFDNGNYTSGFWNWWGGATRTITWDPAKDAQLDTNSGSINITVDFPGAGDNQYAQGMSLSGSGSYNGGISIHTAGYSAMEFDLLWDTNSTLSIDTINSNGDPNALGIGIASTTWGQTWIPNPNQPRVVADGAWHHISIPLDPTWPDTAGVIFKKWFPAQAQYTGTMNFWVDNLSFTPSSAPIPPPAMTLRRSANGLNLFLAQPGQQYQRESIRSIAADSSQWISNSAPVTYSMTIADFPTTPGVQAHIFLVPDAANNQHAPDYANANAIMLDIRGNAAGAGNATFRWKTNQPNANSQMYTSGQGQVGTLNAPTVRGTWSVSFANDTNITVSGPGGAVTNWTMPPDAAALFYSGTPVMGTYFGTQPNNPVSIGQNVGISEIKITSGSTVVVDDHFDVIDPFQQVDPTLWQLEMDNQNGIFVITNQPSFWLGWSLPDAGFALRQKPDLNSPGVDPGLTPILNGGSRLIKLTPDVLTNAQQSYFYLLKQ
jgi:hypothetical protein